MIVFISDGKDNSVTKTSEAPSSVTTSTEEEKGNVKFAAGTTFNREKTGGVANEWKQWPFDILEFLTVLTYECITELMPLRKHIICHLIWVKPSVKDVKIKI